MPQEHTVKAFSDELNHLEGLISQMGGYVERIVHDSIQAVSRRDSVLATRTTLSDDQIDALEDEVNESAVRLLALRQPMATDLRSIIAALKISGDLERIGDYAANVSKRTIVLNECPPIPSALAVARLGRLVLANLKDVLDTYGDKDADKAINIWHRDEEVDEIHTSIFRELLTYMMEDPRNITACTHLLFIAKNIERMGDHTTNIAEVIHYMVRGVSLTKDRDRPKSDSSSYAPSPLDDATEDGILQSILRVETEDNA